MTDYIDIVMSEPPGPESQFVEVEDANGDSISIGTWIRPLVDGGFWRLRIPIPINLGNEVP